MWKILHIWNMDGICMYYVDREPMQMRQNPIKQNNAMSKDNNEKYQISKFKVVLTLERYPCCSCKATSTNDIPFLRLRFLEIIINCFGHACTWKQGGQTAADVGGGGEDRGGLGGPVGPPVGSGGSFQEDTKREEEGKCALTGGISRVGGGKDQTVSKSLGRNF